MLFLQEGNGTIGQIDFIEYEMSLLKIKVEQILNLALHELHTAPLLKSLKISLKIVTTIWLIRFKYTMKKIWEIIFFSCLPYGKSLELIGSGSPVTFCCKSEHDAWQKASYTCFKVEKLISLLITHYTIYTIHYTVYTQCIVSIQYTVYSQQTC